MRNIRPLHMKSRVQFKFPTPNAWGSNSPPPWKTLIIKFPPPRDGKGVKCPGEWGGGGGGVLKLRFDRYIFFIYINCLEFTFSVIMWRPLFNLIQVLNA